ncbi:MAG: polynucleotide adenylyltransferase PcnB, partial [Parachlamydiales bacterium]|nr:polynucleotide adenylyltransferase PcnB [Parachlamydiales bacterium]
MEPTIYSASAHHIRRENIDPDALFILSKLTRNGYLSYLVGGGVRDLLMGHIPKDFDIATSARPEEIKKIFRHCLLIGRRFRLAHVRFGLKVIEVSTFRAGDTNEENLIIRDNCWGPPEEDVLRRDFTLNGLFYSATDDTVIDYVGGYQDLNKRLLRTIGNPESRFKQDPVRMIRLLKFRARFGLAVEAATWNALESCKSEITKSSPARVLEELLKMLESGASLPFFKQMTSTGLLAYLFPRLSRHLQQEEGKEIFKFLETIDLLIKRNKRRKPDRSVLVTALLFPLIMQRLPELATQDKVDFGHLANTTHEILEQL